MLTCMFGRCVAFTVLLVGYFPTFRRALTASVDSCTETECRFPGNQFWQSLEEGAGKRNLSVRV